MSRTNALTPELVREKLADLTALWHKLVQLDAHVNSDSDWYITSAWEQGGIPSFRVHHAGALGGAFNQVSFSYAEAERLLLLAIVSAFEAQFNWAETCRGDFGSEDMLRLAERVSELRPEFDALLKIPPP